MNTMDFLRQFRIEGFAIFDLTVAFAGVFLAAPLLSKLFRKMGLEVPKSSWLLWTLPIGIAVHLLFGKMTPFTKDFLDLHGHYISKIAIIGLFVLGLTGVKKVDK